VDGKRAFNVEYWATEHTRGEEANSGKLSLQVCTEVATGT